MDIGKLPQILRCGLCKKPFDTEASLKRHGYYCRTRRGVKRSGLPRSCILCARSKVRCDKLSPRCSKCATKNLACQYPTNSTRNAGSETQQLPFLDNAEEIPPETSGFSVQNSSIIPQRTDEVYSELVNDAASTLDLPDMRSETFEWDLADELLPFEYLQDTLPIDVSDSSTPVGIDGILRNYAVDNQFATSASMYNNDTRIPHQPTFKVRFLKNRSKFRAGAQIIANNMARILCSYPKMMLDYNTLPPFIHPQWISASSSEPFLEPLSNCMSLLGMLSTRARGSASLFWRNVRMECDRLAATYTTFSRPGIIAATQALLLYMLVRVAEGETEHNNHDAALLGTLTLVLGGLTKEFQYESPLKCTLDMSYLSLESDWNNWIFEESRRRAAVVFRIINMLVNMSPVTTCDSQPGVLIAPLPARKQLWEAGGERQWRKEMQRAPAANVGYALAVSGDLIGLDEYERKSLTMNESLETWTSLRSKDNWEEWCAGMDGLGAVIMLAASLPA